MKYIKNFEIIETDDYILGLHKKYESLNDIEVGDYVVLDSVKIDSGTYNDVVGHVLDIYPRDYISIEFKIGPLKNKEGQINFDVGYGQRIFRYSYQRNKIIFWTKDEKDLDIFLKSKKFNL